MFTAPLSRRLAVAEPSRAVAFYRDVVGLAETPLEERYGFPATAELVSGPVRLQIGQGTEAPDSTGVMRPRGTAQLFLETDELDALHTRVTAQGATPSSIEKLNWIKYRVFQLRDPDGHTLWFGQSDDVPEAKRAPDVREKQIPSGRGQLRRVIPELPLRDVPAGVRYYCDMLGFRINYAQGDFGLVFRDEISIALITRTERHQGIGSCYLYIRDADALHAELVARGARVQDAPVSMPWGLRQFHVLDPDGNQLTFGQPFE